MCLTTGKQSKANSCIHTYKQEHKRNYRYQHTYDHKYKCAYKHKYKPIKCISYVHVCMHTYIHNIRMYAGAIKQAESYRFSTVLTSLLILLLPSGMQQWTEASCSAKDRLARRAIGPLCQPARALRASGGTLNKGSQSLMRVACHGNHLVG